MDNIKKLGIIGGLGPMTSAVFLEMIVNNTDAGSDQEHIPIVMEHCPQVPDRTAYIFDKSKPNPLPYIIEAGKNLAAAGACEIAIPCFTAHYFHDIMQHDIPVPVINGIKEVADYLTARDIKSAGVMATDGTVRSDLFGSALRKADIECIYPDEAFQKKVMSLIYDEIKSGKEAAADDFFDVIDHLKKKGAATVILGCTELSVAKKQIGDTADVTDALLVLALKCVGDFKK